MRINIALILLLLLFSLSATINAKAQSRISSVYGVNLGDSESVVASKISGSWKTTSEGKRYYRTNRPTLGNCTFESGNFCFESGKLNRVYFTSSDGGSMDPDFQNPNGGLNGYEQFLSKSERFQKMYHLMYSDLSGKYGSPIIDDGDRAIWKSNGNMIELKYVLEDTTNQFGWHDGYTMVRVAYLVGSSTPSNF